MSRLYQLLKKYTKGICSKKEFDELMDLLQEAGNDKAVRQYIREMYNSLESEIISDSRVNSDGEILLEEAFVTERSKSRSFLKRRRLAISSVSSLILLSGFILYYIKPFHKPGLEKNTSRITAPAGSRTSIILPDSTEVWLNSLSSITYATGFNNGKREVTLEGEALFKVTHDSLHPFVVHTKTFDVTDLGTVFNVRAYTEDKDAQAALISGSIEIQPKEVASKKILLIPNQCIIIPNHQAVKNESGRILIKPIITDAKIGMAVDTAWVVDKLIFNDECFKDLALKMQRHYNVEIFFSNEKVKHYKFTGRFEDENIDAALQELQSIASFTYKKSNNEIYIE